jgi:hypothetical protein
MSLHPVPTLPTLLCRFDVRWYINSCFRLHYEASGFPSGSFTMPQFLLDWQDQIWSPYIRPTTSFFANAREVWAFFNDGTTTRSWPHTNLVPPPPLYPSFVSPTLCMVVSTQSSFPGPHGRGRVCGYPVPKEFCDATDGWSMTGLVAAVGFAGGILSAFSSQGLGFSPVVFSPATLAVGPMIGVNVLSGPRSVMRRSDRRRQPGDTHWTFPLVP